MDTTRLATLGVLAGAYRKGHKSALLTHTYNLETDRVLCTRVKSENMADEYSASETERGEPPTCPRCRARDPRFSGVAL